jgi:hypothetical protein
VTAVAQRTAHRGAYHHACDYPHPLIPIGLANNRHSIS